MDEIKVFHDAEARTLTVWFGRPDDERVCEEVGGGVVLMKDGEGAVVGFEKLGFVAATERLRLTLETGDDPGGDAPKKGSERDPIVAPVRGRPVCVKRGGSVVGALISEEDFALYQRLLAAAEDRLDVAAARAALLEVGSISLEELEAELGP